jgi:ketosteroid isomerase-like protein
VRNEEVIESFYQAFSEKNAEKMVAYYHPDIVFNDPAFGELQKEEAGDMWRMLVLKGGDDLSVELLNIDAQGDIVNAKWRARYRFGKKKRPVVNEVSATFKFKDGQIVRHQDDFDLWKWAAQAMGITGKLLGWTNFFKRKVQGTTKKQLATFTSKKKS